MHPLNWRHQYFLILLMIFLGKALYAEYRVYQYIIETPKAFKPQTTIISTLNKAHYLAYHPLSSNQRLTLLRTWMCPGSTADFKKVCPSPYQKLVEVAP